MKTHRLSYREAAEYLGITERQLRRYKNDGRIGYVTFGGRVEFNVQQLDAFLTEHTHEPKGNPS